MGSGASASAAAIVQVCSGDELSAALADVGGANRKRLLEALTSSGPNIFLLHDPPFYYNPENYPAPWRDDGIRGRAIDGNAISAFLRNRVRERLAKVREEVAARAVCAGDLSREEGEVTRRVGAASRPPGLSVILVGRNAASMVYVKRKRRACSEVGISSTLIELSEEKTAVESLTGEIKRLNEDPSCDGILVQMPLPEGPLQDHASEILSLISPEKDVDGFHPVNLGLLVSRRPRLRPCTPFGVMHLLWSTGVNPYGLRCLVVGASNHVGRPMALELLLNGCSVTVAHAFTPRADLESFVRESECIIVAVGKPKLIPGHWIRPGAIVIDVGINRVPVESPEAAADVGSPPKYRLVGDVDFEAAKERAAWITPVPGGVGPMTVAMLLGNTLVAYEDAMGLTVEQPRLLPPCRGQCTT